MSDDRLAHRAAEGDGAAFSAIYARYHQPLYRYCLSIVRNAEDAQDALQNSMVQALRGLSSRDRDLPVRPWLFRIAHNEAVSVLRRRRAAGELDEETGMPGADPEEELDARSRLQQLVSDLQRLPERSRGALLMRELAGLEYQEIAVAMGVSQAAARQMVYEARVGLHEFAEGRAMPCEDVKRSISDGDGRRLRSRRLRVHLGECPECRRFAELMAGRQADLAALVPPLPVGTAASVLQAVLGSGGGGPGGGGLLAGVTGGTGQLAGALTGVKGLAATLALVTTAAVGLAASDERDHQAPARTAASTAPATARVSAPAARHRVSRPTRRATRGPARGQHARRTSRIGPRVTKGIPFEPQVAPVPHEPEPEPDHAAAPSPPAAPPAPPRSEPRRVDATDLVAGLISTTTVLAAPEATLKERSPIELPTLDAAEVLQSDLLRGVAGR
jgi:RNA polymerase sigma factor (sigma-70 family)